MPQLHWEELAKKHIAGRNTVLTIPAVTQVMILKDKNKTGLSTACYRSTFSLIWYIYFELSEEILHKLQT